MIKVDTNIIIVEQLDVIEAILTSGLRRFGHDVSVINDAMVETSTESLSKSLSEKLSEKLFDTIGSKKPVEVVILNLNLVFDAALIAQTIRQDMADAGIFIIALVPSDRIGVFKHESGIAEIESIVNYASEQELMLMVRAALLHSQSASESETLYVYGELEVNLATCKAKLAGRELKFTPMQFQVLSVLVSHPGNTIDRNKLLKMALGDSIRLVGRNVDVHVSAIRMKLGSAADMVETIRGIGYRFNPLA